MRVSSNVQTKGAPATRPTREFFHRPLFSPHARTHAPPLLQATSPPAHTMATEAELVAPPGEAVADAADAAEGDAAAALDVAAAAAPDAAAALEEDDDDVDPIEKLQELGVNAGERGGLICGLRCAREDGGGGGVSPGAWAEAGRAWAPPKPRESRVERWCGALRDAAATAPLPPIRHPRMAPRGERWPVGWVRGRRRVRRAAGSGLCVRTHRGRESGREGVTAAPPFSAPNSLSHTPHPHPPINTPNLMGHQATSRRPRKPASTPSRAS